jgi:hypothetical protein
VISSTPHGPILFAGGCHVNGYPVGESSSFSEITANALGCACTRIAPIGLSNTSRLFDYLELHPRPNILVLQFGNYEAPRPLAKHFRAVFSSTGRPSSAPRSSVSSSQRPWLSLPPDQVFSPTPAWRSRVLLKQAYAIAAQRVEPPLFDAAAIRLKLRMLLTRIAPYEIPITIVLTPLPCADHMARSFRIAAAPIFHEEAAAAGLRSLDTATALGYTESSSKRSFDIYADERHLNLCGHQLLADALTRLLKPYLPDSVSSVSELEGMHV